MKSEFKFEDLYQVDILKMGCLKVFKTFFDNR